MIVSCRATLGVLCRRSARITDEQADEIRALCWPPPDDETIYTIPIGAEGWRFTVEDGVVCAYCPAHAASELAFVGDRIPVSSGGKS